LEQVADRFAIQDAIARYARGLDRRDWDILRCAFHPDALIDQADFKGGVDGLIAFLAPRHNSVEQSSHLLTNCLIEFHAADGALAETCYLAFLRAPGPEGGQIETRALGRYVDCFERRSGDWRIAQRTVVFEHIGVGPAPPSAPISPAWAMSRRDADDPLLVERRRLGLANAAVNEA
jgi:hypothetical protein